VLLCEHASNHMPQEYEKLGLAAADLRRHIAWDIGAAAVTRGLADRLGATAFLGTYSRLLIDLNRPLAAPSSIVRHSEDTPIPGNLAVGPIDVARRAERIFWPFHRAITDHLDRRRDGGRPTRLVTIHSFTPVYLGVPRPWDAGILYEGGVDFGQQLITRLRAAGLRVDANVPYRTDRAEDFAIPIHGDDRGIPAVLVEIRNDLVAGDDDATLWAHRLAEALSA
jgi:predicted N-formylglutamate amidohydrolase